MSVAEKDRHGRKQHRRALDGKSWIGKAEAVYPIDFREEPNDLPERERNPDAEHADDERIEAGIGEECRPDLPVQHDHHESAQDEEYQHPDEKNPGRGKLKWINFVRHSDRGSAPN